MSTRDRIINNGQWAVFGQRSLRTPPKHILDFKHSMIFYFYCALAAYESLILSLSRSTMSNVNIDSLVNLICLKEKKKKINSTHWFLIYFQLLYVWAAVFRPHKSDKVLDIVYGRSLRYSSN
jgi:hypothetical protein